MNAADRQPAASPVAYPLTLVASFALLVLVTLIVVQGRAVAGVRAQPGFVVIQTDDQTLEELYATYTPPGGAPLEAMPNTLGLIAERGVTFNRYHTPYALCAPSRVSLLTGRYPHNHNDRGNVPPNDGYSGFASRGAFSHNLAVWLQQAGYRTVHVGKFLNGYGDEPYDNGTTVPPGWSSWWAVPKADTDHYFYGYRLNHNGVIEGPYGDSGSWDTREYGVRDDLGCPLAPLNGLSCYYETDKLNELATQELAATPATQPFYLQLDYTAPHGDFRRPAGPEPAPRHSESFAGVPFPHGAAEGLNEGNVNDKPSFIRQAPYLAPSEAHTYRVYYQKALESLRSVDDGVGEIVAELGALHRLGNTYIIFTSDNGLFFGEHRLTGGKFLAYEPSAHLPLLMRGPGITPGSQTGELASTIDIAPTILELAGAAADKSIDGRSLYPYAHDTSLRSRRPILLESFVESSDVEDEGLVKPAARMQTSATHGPTASASIVAPPKDYEGVRLGPYKYIEWPNGEKELYDITKDPNELNNKVRDPNFFPIRTFLHGELERLRDLCRAGLPGSRTEAALDSRPAAEGRTRKGKGTARTRTRTRKARTRTRRAPTGTRKARRRRRRKAPGRKAPPPPPQLAAPSGSGCRLPAALRRL